jgi:hypothetical protein
VKRPLGSLLASSYSTASQPAAVKVCKVVYKLWRAPVALIGPSSCCSCHVQQFECYSPWSLQFPGSKEEEGVQREGRTPKVDTVEEAAAPAHEYEFQPQASARSGCRQMVH